jgi:hypothetical protein
MEPDLSITWDGFREEFSNVSSWRRAAVVNDVFVKQYRQKVVEWEGTVLGVESFEGDPELMLKNG